MKTILFVLLLLTGLLALACDDTAIYAQCGGSCYTGTQQTRLVGACADGVYVCDEMGRITECSNEINPVDEICDGIDNDCDGFTDNTPETGLKCAGLCGIGIAECSGETIVCRDLLDPQQETCDGIDNDCDGDVDEYEDLPIEVCDVPQGIDPAVFISPPCSIGIKLCVKGENICTGQTLPSYEVCDGIDNDCNRITDDVPGIEPGNMDIVDVVDLSGSMTSKLPRVKDVLLSFTSTANPDRAYYNLYHVELAHLENLWRYEPTCHPDPANILPCDISTYNSVIDAMRVYGTAEELTYDAIVDIAVNHPWQSSRKIIIYFGDEHPHTLTGLTENSVRNILQLEGVEFIGVLQVSPDGWIDYDNLGFVTNLFEADLVDIVHDRLIPVCAR